MLNTPSVISSLRAVGRQVAQDGARGVRVAVRKDLDRRAAETRAVDDARVVQLVGNDEVFLGEDGGDGAGVRGEAALKDDGRFGFLELREPPLELHVNRHRAGDRAHRAGADAELLDRRQRLLFEPRVRRQPEVVVRREIDDVAAVDRRARGLPVVEHAQTAVETLRFEGVQFVGEK